METTTSVVAPRGGRYLRSRRLRRTLERPGISHRRQLNIAVGECCGTAGQSDTLWGRGRSGRSRAHLPILPGEIPPRSLAQRLAWLAPTLQVVGMVGLAVERSRLEDQLLQANKMEAIGVYTNVRGTLATPQKIYQLRTLQNKRIDCFEVNTS